MFPILYVADAKRGEAVVIVHIFFSTLQPFKCFCDYAVINLSKNQDACLLWSEPVHQSNNQGRKSKYSLVKQ